ncbi:MAG: hypothetical protein ING68_04330 [Rhodocyclaceae bacterium]|nr:hypothetical protein [Rhodocyclaceae bacterium]
MLSQLPRYARRLAWFVLASMIAALGYLCVKYLESRNRVVHLATKLERQVTNKPVKSGNPYTIGMSQGPSGANGFAWPENSKLGSIIGQLRENADRGNAYASCRLAMELKRCMFHESREVPRMQRMNKFKELANGNPNATEHDWRRIEGSDARYAANAYVCEGFKNSEELSADKYILQAALLGHDGAKRYVATVPPLQLLIGGENLDALASRHVYSQQFLHELAQKGDEVALFELAFQQIDGSWWDRLAAGQSLSRNYFDATVYALTADMRLRELRALEPSLQQFSYMNHLALNNRLSPTELEQAHAKAQQLSRGFMPITTESSLRRAALRENNPGVSPQVLMCKE